MPELITSAAASIAELRQLAARGALYAVLDACDEPRVPITVAELGQNAASLYQGKAQEELPAIAPYLARVDPGMLTWIAESLWTDPWGVFAVSDAPLDELRTHFRKFLLVDAPGGDQWYFRFYDPRVLARFLSTCDAAQLADFFGPVTSFGWVDLETYGVTLVQRAWFGMAQPATPRISYRKVAK
jgi:Domain of unknown function (DUF4123)